MNTITKRNRIAHHLRGTALAAVLAGAAIGAFAVPALAQESVTTTRTVTTYDNSYYPGYAPTTTYYSSGPVYYQDSYAYPPVPTYAYVGPAPAPVGVTVGVPFVGVHLGW